MTEIALLDRAVVRAFYGNFKELRPAQKDAIKPLVEGSNVIITAGTGSGKTEAVVAPLVSRHWQTSREDDLMALLYIAPTKALVNDLEKRLGPPCSNLGLRVGIRHGDRDDLTVGIKPNIIITTPESLDVLIFRRDPALEDIRAVVIDEVHQLYNTQRGLQLSILLQRLRILVGQFQWAAMSATIGCLQDIRDFFFGAQEPAVFLEYPTNRFIDAKVRSIDSMANFCGLLRLLVKDTPAKFLIFVDSRRKCEQLSEALILEPAFKGAVFPHYSSLSAEVRLEHEQRFADLRTAVCIATSTLELGIDIGDIDAVILWGVPDGIESFLQRIGRGNRRGDKTNVICLVPDDSKNPALDVVSFLVLIDMARKGEMPTCLPYELYGAVGQQCLSYIASGSESYIKMADLFKLVAHKPYLDRSSLELIMAELQDDEYVKRHAYKNRYGSDENLHRLVRYRMIYGNYAIGSEEIDVRYMSKTLGSVPKVNLLIFKPGSSVRFKGEKWRVVRASPDGFQFEHAKATTTCRDFTYGTKVKEVYGSLVDDIWHFIHQADISSFSILTKDWRDRIRQLVSQFRAISTQEQIPYKITLGGIEYLTFGGKTINRAIALISGQHYYDADDFRLVVSSPITWGSIPTEPAAFAPVYADMFEGATEQTLYQTLLPADLQLQELLQDWLKNKVHIRVLERLASSKPVETSAASLPTI